MSAMNHRNHARTRTLVLRVMIAAIAVTLGTAVGGDALARRSADLVERQVGNPPAQLSAGGSFTLRDVAANRGERRAGPSVTRYSLVNGATVLLVGSRPVPALKRHQRSRGTVRLSIPAAAPAGRYALLACVDANRQVAESNEQNNCRASGRRVVVSARPVTPADSDGDGFPDSVDCAPHDPSIHPGATDLPDPGFVDSNCDGIDGDASHAVFVSPVGSDSNPGTLLQPLLTLGAAVSAASSQGKDVYASAGTYAEELRVAAGVSVYGGYGEFWQRSLSLPTRITGAVSGIGDTEGAFAFEVTTPTTLQLLTISPAAPTVAGASSYGLRGVRSPGLRLEHVTITAAPGALGAAGAAGHAGAPGGDGGTPADNVGIPHNGGTSPVGHPGGDGGHPGPPYSSTAADGAPGLLTSADPFGRMGGPGGLAGESGGTHTAGTRGYDGDSGVFQHNADGTTDGAGGGAGNVMALSGLWHGRTGHDALPGTDGHGGGGGGGGGGDPAGFFYPGAGGGGGGGGQGGGGGHGGSPGGGSFAIFLVDSQGAVIRDSMLTAQNGGAGGRGGGGALGGPGGAPGHGGFGPNGDESDGGDGGRGGAGGRGGDGGGGAGGPSAAVLGLTPADTPGTVLSHGLGGTGGAGGVGAGNGGGRGADGPSLDYLNDGP